MHQAPTDLPPHSVFPGKTSIPTGSLYSLRVWLRVNGIDHRIFQEDELWVGKDLDFNSIGDASFVRLKSVDSKAQIYHGFVGRALVTFTCRYTQLVIRLIGDSPHPTQVASCERELVPVLFGLRSQRRWRKPF